MDFVVDREARSISFFWSYPKEIFVTELHIYKNTKGSAPSLWKVLNAQQTSVIDKDIHINTTYEYYFLPSLAKGKFAQGEKIEVEY